MGWVEHGSVEVDAHTGVWRPDVAGGGGGARWEKLVPWPNGDAGGWFTACVGC